MALFRLERTAPLPPEEVWRRLTLWSRHGDVVPLTRVVVETPPPTGRGTVFVARTVLGPLHVDDRMEVTVWRPPAGDAPGLCRLEKRGRVVLGWAEIEVAPRPGGRTRVRWTEDIGVRLVPAFFDPVLRGAGRWVFGRAADRLLRTP
ncbi:SRPBCC family protein [Streptomyces longwoodensis]|uniref:SRPBCC family protein n=1 Tax=Streptomyces longwoodensis TaxID=68231 RepID=UPI00382DF9AE